MYWLFYVVKVSRGRKESVKSGGRLGWSLVDEEDLKVRTKSWVKLKESTNAMQMKTFVFHRGLFSFLLSPLSFDLPRSEFVGANANEDNSHVRKTTMWESAHQSVRVCVCLQDKDDLRKKEKMWNLVLANFAAGRHKLELVFCCWLLHFVWKLRTWSFRFGSALM